MSAYCLARLEYIDNTLLALNSFHKNIKSTSETEKDNTIPFLVILTGFYPSNFVYSHFFWKTDFLYCCRSQHSVRCSHVRHQEIWVSRFLKNAFPKHFLASRTYCPLLINIIFPHEYYGLVIKYTKSHRTNQCIKFGNKPPRLPCWQVILFFCNQTWQGQLVMLSLDFLFTYEQKQFNSSNIQLE